MRGNKMDINGNYRKAECFAGLLNAIQSVEDLDVREKLMLYFRSICGLLLNDLTREKDGGLK